MIFKILGILDLITALVFLINNWFDKTLHWFPDKIVLVLAIYLIIKGIFFLISLDFASIIDIICGIVIILSLYFTIPLLLAAIIFIYLLQKSILCLIS